MRIRRAITAAALALGATTALTVPATTASAVPANWECEASSFCIYHGENGEPPRLALRKGAYDLGGISGGKLNDHVYSARNISGKAWCLYEHAGYKSPIDTIPDKFQGKIADHIRNRVSSVKAC
ncbi:peptidase inhibitor family I36 protein [Saccharothrix australiensis]|uniref:Peptidase inhibitor family I36 n=1 Tax=Saccharothrix australiensis TaxID=2072 RepID=A0A495VZV9_9PSEU|nr:peptidase inhibitor family I36 protein [Saccharothrix australiensis]RKT54297.1 peptidase inhibitor family I36 [Saccharothrix australiensis]